MNGNPKHKRIAVKEKFNYRQMT